MHGPMNVKCETRVLYLQLLTIKICPKEHNYLMDSTFISDTRHQHSTLEIA